MRSTFVPSALGSAILAAGAAASTSKRGEVEMVSASWYTGWHVDTMGVDAIPWDKYTHVTYSFAQVWEDPSNVTLTTEGDEENLQLFVEAAHNNGVKALLSIGGWAGSQFFSPAVGSAENRTAFAGALQNITSEYGLDGLDFDWEYPDKTGIGCNLVSPDDTSNFLEFVTEIRASDWASDLILTAAAPLLPWLDGNGVSSTDVSGFAKVFDWIALMNYDVWGSWSSAVGPNAPLNDSCTSSNSQAGSAVSAVAAWSAAGIPASQLILGVASYGHSFKVDETDAFVNGSDTELAAYPSFDATAFPLGDAWDDAAGTPDACGVIQTNGGNWDMWALVQSGLLNQDGSPAQGTLHRFDNCSQTDYVYNTETGIEISYDSPTAFYAKGQFIASSGLRGFAMWETAGDYNSILVDAILAGTDGDASSIDIDGCSDIDI